MFKIKYYLEKSPVHGIGVFATQRIKKGEIIYIHTEKLDTLLSEEEFNNLNDEEKRIFKHYGYFDSSLKKWKLDHDDIRFCNHSKNSNITLVGGKILAKRNIKKGEELLQDYAEFGGELD